jgi:hypothetical protein
MTTPEFVPVPVSSVPACALCGGDAVVNWLRRPTEAEVAAVVAAEESRREQVLLLADKDLPAPVFGPLPTGEGMTRSVYACAMHALDLEAAALIHANTCTAPNPAYLPGCDCTPEAPTPEPGLDTAPAVQLPDTWISG